jgi:uncharacterized protein
VIIDAHAHAYPEEDLAMVTERSGMLDQSLPDTDPNKWMLHHEGSLASLLTEERIADIDRFVLLPVSSRPERTRSLNRWVADMARNHPEIIPFGTLVANSSSLADEFEEVLDLGLRGIKVHPFLQRVDILAPAVRKFWSLLEESGLPVVLDSMYLKGLMKYKPHLKDLAKMAGAFETGPARISTVARSYPGLTLIAPHLGSLYAWDRLEPLYPLENVFFDLSFVSFIVSPREAAAIIRRKGSDHVLFGTDAPWRKPLDAKKWFEELPLTAKEFELISHGNLEAILGTPSPNAA